MGFGSMDSVIRNRYGLPSGSFLSLFSLSAPPSSPGHRPPSAAEQFLEVVRQADQVPFAAHFLQPAQQELPEAPHLFDLSEDRLHHSLAFRIRFTSLFRAEFAAHPLLGGQILGDGTVRIAEDF